mgnify:FL=1
MTVAVVLAEAARMRQETRGSHWREDFPETDDVRWFGHIEAQLAPGGLLRLDYVPARPVEAGSSAPTTGEVP